MSSRLKAARASTAQTAEPQKPAQLFNAVAEDGPLDIKLHIEHDGDVGNLLDDAALLFTAARKLLDDVAHDIGDDRLYGVFYLFGLSKAAMCAAHDAYLVEQSAGGAK